MLFDKLPFYQIFQVRPTVFFSMLFLLAIFSQPLSASEKEIFRNPFLKEFFEEEDRLFAEEDSGFLENMIDVCSGTLVFQGKDHEIQAKIPLPVQKIFQNNSWDFHSLHLAFYNLQNQNVRLFDGNFKLLFFCPAVSEKSSKEIHWWNSAKKKKKIKMQNEQKQQLQLQFYKLDFTEAATLAGKNQKITGYAGWIDGKKEHLKIVTPDARQLFYKAVLKKQNKDAKELLTDEISYLLEKEINKDGVFLYSYDERKRPSLVQAVTFDEEQVISWLRFSYLNPYLYDTDFDVYTSDGHVFQYRLEKKNKRIFLKSLKSSLGREQNYTYVWEKGRSFLKSAFFAEPVNPESVAALQEKKTAGAADCLAQCLFKDKTYVFEYYPAKSPSEFKVKAVYLKKKDQADVCLYRLAYGPQKTEVVDGSGLRKIYFYNAQKKICRIDFFNSQDRFICSDRFIFSENRLTAKYRLDADFKTYFAYVYGYDEKGNLVFENLAGSLSGIKQTPLQFRSDGMPITDGPAEAYAKKRRYDQNNRIVLQEEGQKKTRYCYEQDRLCRRLVCNGEDVCKRFFYSYNSDGFLTEIILDDGANEDKDDLGQVTERKILRIFPKTHEPFYGCTKSWAVFGLQNGKEKLIRRAFFTYSSNGKIEKEQCFGPGEEKIFAVQKEYDSYARICRIQDSRQEETVFAYDAKGRVASKKEKKGQLQYIYDEAQNNIQEKFSGIDGKNSICQAKYDALKSLLRQTDDFDNRINYIYDDLGFLREKQLPSCLNEEGEEKDIVEKSFFDVWGNPVLRIDPLGRKTAYAFNARGDVIGIVHPDGSKESFYYYLDGSLKSHIDQLQIKTVYVRDAFKRPLKKQIFSPADSLLCQESYSYSSFHMLASIDASGRKKQYFFDYAGRLQKTVENSRKTFYGYNNRGFPCFKKIQDPNSSYLFSFAYDKQGSLAKEEIRNLQNNVSVYKKYERDWNFSRIDSKHHRQYWLYDSLGRLIKKSDGLKEPAEYEYVDGYRNILGQKVLLQKKKKGSKEQIKIYDALKRLVCKKEKEPLKKEERIYDEGSFLRKKTKVDFSGKKPFLKEVFYDYSSAGHLVKKRTVLPFFEKTAGFECDAKGRQLKIVRATGDVIEKSYDFLGHLKSLKSADGSIDYTYYYNASGDLLQADNKTQNRKTAILRDELGRRIGQIDENSLRFETQKDVLGLNRKIVLPDSSFLLFDWQGCFLKRTRRIWRDNVLYDHAFLEDKETKENILEDLESLAYEFDLEGNKIRADSSVFYQDITNNSYEHLEENVVRNANGDIVLKKTSGGEIEYEFDALGRLAVEKSAFRKIVYGYDALNRRIKKRIYLKKENEEELKSEENYIFDGVGEIGAWNINADFLKLKAEGNLLQGKFQAAIEK